MGFETVVRPVVFPNIRPAPAQPQAPASDPTKGLAVIHGASGKHIDLPFSWSVSSSQSRQVETQRRVDVTRVYQMDDDGTVNKDNFIDVEVATKITMKDGKTKIPMEYEPPQEEANIEIKERRKIKPASAVPGSFPGDPVTGG